MIVSPPVEDPRIFGVVSTGEVFIATVVPEPEIEYSPTTPALLYSIFVLVPLVIVVVPTVMPEPPPEQADPLARQIAPEPETAVPSAVPTPVPRPETPVLIGTPVKLVPVSAGVLLNVGAWPKVPVP